MPFHYSINGLTVDDTTQQYGMWLLGGTEYAPALAPRRTDVQIPGKHYQVPYWKDPQAPAHVSMKVRIRGSSPLDLRNRWDALTSLLGLGLSGPAVLLGRKRDGVPDEQANAQLLTRDAPAFTSTMNMLDTTMIFNVPGGCWRSTGWQIDSFGNGSANIESANIANQSTMPVSDVEIQIPGPVSYVQVRDAYSRTGVQWGSGSVTIPTGKYLYINTDTMRAYQSDAAGWDQLVNPVNVSNSLVLVDQGPLVLVSAPLVTGTPPTVTRDSKITASWTGSSTGPLQLRARYARA